MSSPSAVPSAPARREGSGSLRSAYLWRCSSGKLLPTWWPAAAPSALRKRQPSGSWRRSCWQIWKSSGCNLTFAAITARSVPARTAGSGLLYLGKLQDRICKQFPRAVQHQTLHEPALESTNYYSSLPRERERERERVSRFRVGIPSPEQAWVKVHIPSFWELVYLHSSAAKWP